MAYSIDIISEAGKKLSTKKLNEAIFNDENINESLIHEFVLMQLSNARNPIAHTKSRGEVKGSGRKLYRQKGTGRARVGNAASPIRRGGGVAFGPRNNANFIKNMPKKMRRKALFGALTLKAKDSELVCLKEFKAKEIKTKNAADVMAKLGLADEKTLFVISSKDETTMKSFRNLPNVKYVLVDYVNPYDLLTHKKVLFLEESFDKLEDIFLS